MACTKPLGAGEAARKKPLGATWVDRPEPRAAGEVDRTTPLNATEVDRRLRQALHQLQLAERNAVLWFAEVLKRRLFKDLGFSSIYQYAGEALGFSPPRTAQFIRLCTSLEELPALRDSVTTGVVSWTKAREVAKVATPQTESAWVDLARTESRRKLERRVRMAQTRSRAKRRDGGWQLGLADSGANQAHSIGATPVDPSSAQAGISSAIPADPSSAHTACDDAVAMPSDVAFADVPVTLSLRFTPEQYARYEAIFEKLRKCGERGAREELILAGLEALLVEAGSVAADPVSARGAQSPAVRNTGLASPREAESAAARGVTSASARKATTSPRDAKSASTSDAGAISPRNLKAVRQIPAYQIVVQQCEDCGRAQVQTSRGAKLIDPAAAEAMRCDARVLRPGERIRLGERIHPGEKIRPGEKSRSGEKNRLGEQSHPSGRNRATIPPGMRREVLARDGYRCRTPGCGSARFLEVHHVVSRAAGGSNRPDNLVTLCSACHRLTHSLPLHASGFPGASTSEAPRRAIPVSRRDVGPVSPSEGAADSPHQAISPSERGGPRTRGSHGSTHDQQPQRSPFPRRPHEGSPHQPPGNEPETGANGADSGERRAIDRRIAKRG